MDCEWIKLPHARPPSNSRPREENAKISRWVVMKVSSTGAQRSWNIQADGDIRHQKSETRRGQTLSHVTFCDIVHALHFILPTFVMYNAVCTSYPYLWYVMGLYATVRWDLPYLPAHSHQHNPSTCSVAMEQQYTLCFSFGKIVDYWQVMPTDGL